MSPTSLTFDRTDEAEFLAAVPKAISDFRIVEVTGFSPGNVQGRYAAAIAISIAPNHVGGLFATHVVVFGDDRPEGNPRRWYLIDGHYDLGDLDAARQDAARRFA
jgi:hypothetical protein